MSIDLKALALISSKRKVLESQKAREESLRENYALRQSLLSSYAKTERLLVSVGMGNKTTHNLGFTSHHTIKDYLLHGETPEGFLPRHTTHKRLIQSWYSVIVGELLEIKSQMIGHTLPNRKRINSELKYLKRHLNDLLGGFLPLNPIEVRFINSIVSVESLYHEVIKMYREVISKGYEFKSKGRLELSSQVDYTVSPTKKVMDNLSGQEIMQTAKPSGASKRIGGKIEDRRIRFYNRLPVVKYNVSSGGIKVIARYRSKRLPFYLQEGNDASDNRYKLVKVKKS